MKTFLTVTLAGLMMMLGSCTKFINIKLDSIPPELIVEGVITTDTLAHQIILRRTADYFSNRKADRVTGAVIMLSDGVSEIQMTEAPDSAGLYRTPASYYGVVGRTYTITISHVDVNDDGIMETYTSSCLLNHVAPVDSFTIEKRKLVYEDAFVLKLSLVDPENEKNYYIFRVWKNDTLVTDSITLWSITDDDFFNPEYLTNDLKIYLFPRFRHIQYIRDGDHVKVEACGITRDYLSFIREAIEAYRGQNPMLGSQPANIRTNIYRTSPPPGEDDVGARGYFAAYAVAWKEKIYRAP